MRALNGEQERGWALLLVCLESFPPSDDLENYVEYYLRSRSVRACVVALHLTLFRGPLAYAPDAAVLDAALATAGMSHMCVWGTLTPKGYRLHTGIYMPHFCAPLPFYCSPETGRIR